jgi:hypothetical protein
MHPSSAFSVAGLALALTLTACGAGDAADPDGPSPDAGVGASPDAAPQAEPDAGPTTTDPALADEVEARIVGDYVMEQIVVTMQDLPIFGESEGSSTAIGAGSIRREGDGFVITERGCRVEAASGGGVTTTIPDAIPRSVPPRDTPLILTRDGAAVRWQRPLVITLVGVHLDDPDAEPLPTEADDPRVWDQDEDGHPGVTVSVSGFASGDIYVVQRQRASYAGTLDDDGRLSGLVADTSEQSVIGSTNALLDQNIPTTPHPDANRSRIRLVRVAEPYDCDRVVAEADTLFP